MVHEAANQVARGIGEAARLQPILFLLVLLLVLVLAGFGFLAYQQQRIHQIELTVDRELRVKLFADLLDIVAQRHRQNSRYSGSYQFQEGE